MKKVFALALVLAMILSFAACGKGDAESSVSPTELKKGAAVEMA